MTKLFSSMYHFIKGLSDYINSLILYSSEKKEGASNLLFIDRETVALIDSLLECLPVTHENLKYNSKSYEKIKLIQIVDEVESFKNVMPDILPSVSASRDETELTEVWSFKCEKSDSFSTKSWTFNYFDLILDELGKVRFIPEVQLQTCEFYVDNRKVYMNLEWHGPFENIEHMTVPGVKRQFWKATCSNEEMPLSLNVMRYLLYLQLAVAWGENELHLGEILPGGRLSATIQIPVADLVDPSAEPPLSETIRKKVSDYIVQQSYPIYSEVSQKLEIKLSEELEHRKKYVEQGLLESKYVDQIQEWIDSLIQYRQAYLKEIQS